MSRIDCETFLGLRDLLLDVESGRESVRGEGGDGSIDREAFDELRAHRDACESCRASLADVAELEASLYGLPGFEAPEIAISEFSSNGSTDADLRSSNDDSGRFRLWTSVLVSLAASWLVVLILSKPPSSDSVIGPYERSDPAPLTIALGSESALTARSGSSFEVVSLDHVELHDGWIDARVGATDLRLTIRQKSGRPVNHAVEPVARIDLRDALVAVRVRGSAIASLPKRKDDETMSSALKTVPVAAAVSVFVSIGTVTVMNSSGSTKVGPGEYAEVDAGVPPKVVALPEKVAELEKDLRDAQQALEKTQESAVKKIDTLVSRVQNLENENAKLAAAAGSATAAEKTSGEESTREAKIEASRELFAKLSSRGAMALQSSKLQDLVEQLDALGEDGIAIVAEAFASEDGGHRFLAAALAENLKDARLVEPLEKAALEDDNFMVRRMSSHALAFLGSEEAGDSLARIVSTEKRDAGVRVNAWYGLANLGREEAYSSFDSVLAGAGGDVTSDLVVSTAMQVRDPDQRLFPSLRRAYDNQQVSTSVKTRILQVLGTSETGAYTDFLSSVEQNASADQTLRDAAKKALGGE